MTKFPIMYYEQGHILVFSFVQVDLQFLVLGDSTLRKKARDLVESVETMYRSWVISFVDTSMNPLTV